MKVCAVGAELFLADRQADKTKLIVSFSHFAKTLKINPEKSYILLNLFTHPRNFSEILPFSDLYNEVQ
jgi:hypothetical protein